MYEEPCKAEYELLKKIVALRDGKLHRIAFVETSERYAVPCEILIEPSRTAIAIVAIAPQPVEELFEEEAEVLAAMAGFVESPDVYFDAKSRTLTALSLKPIADVIEGSDRLWDAVWPVATRLLAVVYRIDLTMQGLAEDTAALISELEFALWRPQLHRYQPFEESKRLLHPRSAD